jgi:hypothetical protein
MGQRTNLLLQVEGRSGARLNKVYHLQWGYRKRLPMAFLFLLSSRYFKPEEHDIFLSCTKAMELDGLDDLERDWGIYNFNKLEDCQQALSHCDNNNESENARHLLEKLSVAPFLKEDLGVVMCHYPMVTWNQKPRGSIMLHGHSHGKLDDYNALSMDLRFDVGIDGSLANLHFLTLEDIYNAATEKSTTRRAS